MELRISFVLLLVFYANGIVYGNYEAKYRLIDYLFKEYKNEVPPMGDNGTAVIITVEMFGGIVIELKETEQIASYLIAHNQKWTDPRLSWNPEEYNGTESIIVPVEKIWRPDTYIYNSIEVKDLVDEDRDFVSLSYTGELEMNCPQYIQAFCSIAVHMFPFDTQFCTIAITSNQIGVNELNISITSPKYAKFKFMGNSEWELCNVSMVYHELTDAGIWGKPSIEYQYIFQIKRRSTFYVTIIIIPTFLIATLSIIGIFAPGSKNDTGHCVSLGLGALLALMLLLGIVADRLPKSRDMPLLGYYILVILISFVFCVIFESILIYYSHCKIQSGQKPPKWLYRITRTPMNDAEELSKEELTKIQQKQALNIMNGTSIHHSNGSLNGYVPAPNQRHDELTLTLKLMLKLIEEQKKSLTTDVKDKEEQEIEDEWDKIENKLDFFWILIFEGLNIFNLVFLIIFVSAPPPTIDDWLYGKNPIELLTTS